MVTGQQECHQNSLSAWHRTACRGLSLRRGPPRTIHNPARRYSCCTNTDIVSSTSSTQLYSHHQLGYYTRRLRPQLTGAKASVARQFILTLLMFFVDSRMQNTMEASRITKHLPIPEELLPGVEDSSANCHTSSHKCHSVTSTSLSSLSNQPVSRAHWTLD